MGMEAGRTGSNSREKDIRKCGLQPSLGMLWNLMLMVGILGTNVVALYSLSVTRDRISSAEGMRQQKSSSTVGSAAVVPEELLVQLGNIKEKLLTLHASIAQTQQDVRSSREEYNSAHQNTQKILQQISSTAARAASSVSTTSSNSDEQVDSPPYKEVDSGDIITEHDVLNLENSEYELSMGRNLLSKELDEYTAVRELPLGHNTALNIETIVSSVGHACYANKALVTRYMNYTIGQLCPDDWVLAQALILRGCEPLPRRRCLARTPPEYSEPVPFPASLWTTPPSDTVLWTHYTCKSFECLNSRAQNSKTWTDCADCFDLSGPEKTRWMLPAKDRHDMKIDEVLAYKDGRIRVGLDIGGGSGSFAARMREHNVTILTSTLNLNGPFNEFIALRGLAPLFLSVSQRLPFFDNTLDIVHSMHVLSHWLPSETLEFLLYDIDRVLRPGGLFWLDHFYSTEDKLTNIFVPMIEGLGYKKLKWAIGLKTDTSGVKLGEQYFSALLEKPTRPPSSYMRTSRSAN